MEQAQLQYMCILAPWHRKDRKHIVTQICTVNKTNNFVVYVKYTMAKVEDCSDAYVPAVELPNHLHTVSHAVPNTWSAQSSSSSRVQMLSLSSSQGVDEIESLAQSSWATMFLIISA